MKKSLLLVTMAVLALCLITCANKSKSNTPDHPIDNSVNQNSTTMNSYLSLFEIPATDISRAIKFYENILEIKIEHMAMPGMEMGILPYENQTVHGVIMKDGESKPSATGVTIYLNAGNDLQSALDKVEANGGKIILPKTAHADESGFFALFLDSEGNRMGLNSPN